MADNVGESTVRNEIGPIDLNQMTTGVYVKAAMGVIVTATMNLFLTPCGSIVQKVRPCDTRKNACAAMN